MSLGRGQTRRALFIIAVNMVFLGLFVAVLVLSMMKFLAVSGTAHLQMLGYHIRMYLPYFIAVTVIGSFWRKFQAWSGQAEVFASLGEESENA